MPAAGSCVGSSSSAVRVGHSRAVASHTLDFTRLILSRSRRSRTLAVLAATAFATAAVPLLGAGVASATTTGACESATVQYRIVGADGNVVGAELDLAGRSVHLWDTVPGSVQVRLAPGQTVGGELRNYPVSFAEYTTEGPNWYVSGHQSLVDKATVYLTADDVAGTDDAEADLAEAHREDAGLLRPDRPVRR